MVIKSGLNPSFVSTVKIAVGFGCTTISCVTVSEGHPKEDTATKVTIYVLSVVLIVSVFVNVCIGSCKVDVLLSPKSQKNESAPIDVFKKLTVNG